MSFSTAHLCRGRWLHSLHLRQLQHSCHGGTVWVKRSWASAALFVYCTLPPCMITFLTLTFSCTAVKMLKKIKNKKKTSAARATVFFQRCYCIADPWWSIVFGLSIVEQEWRVPQIQHEIIHSSLSFKSSHLIIWYVQAWFLSWAFKLLNCKCLFLLPETDCQTKQNTWRHVGNFAGSFCYLATLTEQMTQGLMPLNSRKVCHENNV